MKSNNAIKLIFASSIFLSLASCGNAAPSPNPVVKQEGRIYLSTNVKTSIVGVGSTKTLTPVLFPESEPKNFKYIAANPNVLSVSNETGVLTGLNPGTSLITCYNDKNNNNVLDANEPRAFASYQVKAKNSSYSVTLPTYNYQIKVDEEITLSPKANGFSISGSWGSYAYNSPYVSSNGTKIKGLKPGTADVVIYATPSGESFSYDTVAHITVIDNTDGSGLRANSVDFTSDVINVTVGQEFTPEYTVSPANSIDTNVTLSSKGEVLKFENGKFTALKAGTAVIDIETPNNKKDRMKVVVSDSSANYDPNYDNYYGDLTWTNGADLKAKLHNIISNGKKSIKYVKSSTNNWETNKIADSKIGDSTKVNVLYNDTAIDKSATQTGWQREHCLAASLMTGITTGDAVKVDGRASDFHNLYAAFQSGNSSRGNKNFGYADKEPITIADNGGSYKFENGANGAFEPSDSDKGKVARAIFYMGVMYDSEETFSSGGISYKAQPIEIVEPNVPYNSISYADFSNTSLSQCATFLVNYIDIVKGLNPGVTDDKELTKLAYSYYKTTNNPSGIGHLSDLLMWNSFEVDEQEMQHNCYVYSYKANDFGGAQGNRNPFVDYPELVEYIYGSLKDQPGSIRNLRPAILGMDIAPTPDSPDQDKDPREDTIMGQCSWNYIPASGNRSDYVARSGSSTVFDVTFGNQTFVATFGQETSRFINRNTEGSTGVTIGSGTSAIDTFTLESVNSFTNVDKVYFYSCGNANSSYSFDIYVNGGSSLCSGTVSGNNPACYGGSFNKTSGKVKIVITGIDGALIFAGIGVNQSN